MKTPNSWMGLQVLSVLLVLLLTLGGCATGSGGIGSPPKKISDTERARLFLEAANASLAESDPTGALQNLVTAEKLDPSNAEVFHSKALAYHAKGDLPSSVTAARRAVALMPNYSDANNTLGKLLMDAGSPAQAEAPLLRAASDPLYRDSYKPNTNLGILYYRLGKLKKAGEHLDKAVAEAPAYACVAYYYRGHLRLKEGDFARAAVEYDRATQKVCANFADAHLALGIAYERGKQFDRARKTFLSIRDSFPNTKVAEQAMERLRYLQ
jgi:type IV pilus assembly protein PilF